MDDTTQSEEGWSALLARLGLDHSAVAGEYPDAARRGAALRMGFEAGWASALEAAQRPPVSPEQREAVRAVVGEQLTRAGLDLDGPPFADDGETQWPVALELRDRMTDAILARFSFPTLGPEKVAAWLDDDLYGVIDRAMQRSWTDVAEYEYAPSEITSAVRTWMDEQCFRRWVPAEPAVQGDDYEAGKNAGKKED